MATSNEPVEEDAADLQFPKDYTFTMSELSDTVNECSYCSAELSEPYIVCEECHNDVMLCVHCFSRGKEMDSHLSNHKYSVVRTDFSLFTSKWSAEDELRLLEAISARGAGNWEDIACYVGETFNAEECERHYFDFYVNNVTRNPFLPEFHDWREETTVIDPMLFTQKKVDPPRAIEGEPTNKDMSCYNAFRGDFEVEFGNTAEKAVSYLNTELWDGASEEIQQLGHALDVAVARSMNNKLKERQRWKRIMREHGLISLRKVFSSFRRYDSTIGMNKYEKLYQFFSLMKGSQVDYLLESLSHREHLMQRITNLRSLREKGIQTFSSARLYLELMNEREEELRQMKNYSAPMMSKDIQAMAINKDGTLITISNRRKDPTPMDITVLSGYEKLTEEEKEMASAMRLHPEVFLNHKTLLIREGSGPEGLKLAKARSLIKIDVNKTRKIYDYLVKKGYIKAPPKSRK